MKKLLLILLCMPLIGLGQNKACDKEPDYIMTVQDFIRTIENEKDNRKYDGKTFQFSIDQDKMSFAFIGMGDAQFKFSFSDFDFDANLEFDWEGAWSDAEDKYYDKLKDASKKKGYKGSVLIIQGTYSYEKSELEKDDYREGEYKFINCCLVIPNKNNNNTSSKKIDNNKEEIEEEIYGVINDPDGYTNVREDKSSKSEIVFKVYKNKRFKIIDNSGNWWLIEYNGEQGYMYKNRIDVIK